jgi:MHS family proline/betaine transporter-like MFS transporter
MAVYMEELVESPIPHAFGVNTVSMLLSLCLFFPLAGRASDRFGRRAVMTLGGVGCAFLGPLALRLIASSSGSGSDKASKTGIGWALAGQLALGIAVSCWGAPMCAWLVEGFEPQARLTSGSIGYNVAQAVAGGSSPALATYLVDRLGPTGPGWIFVALSCLALTALWIVAPPPSKEAPSTAHTCHGRLRRHKDGEFSEVPRTDDDTASLSWNIEMTHSNKY